MTETTETMTYTVKLYEKTVMTTWRKFDNREDADFYANFHAKNHAKVTVEEDKPLPFSEEDEAFYYSC
tara:strand:- start:1216 stop:1419 length:204 start_codon:yes stop_codon:yes gene_type:complete